ncbi:structural protein 2 [Ceratitis capitata negev-like virus 2]|nr:structural protein 2 [Ceratitis capitata negev-like virus 2]
MSFVNANNIPTAALVVSPPQRPGFFDSVFLAYGKLTSKPVALIVFIIATLSLIAESNTQRGPLELIVDALIKYINSDHPQPLKSLVTLVIGLLNFVIANKPTIFLILLVIVIPLAYDDTSPFVFGLLLLYVIVTKTSALWIFLVIQLVFIYFSVSSYWDKIFIFIFILFLIFGVENFSTFFTQLPSNSTHTFSDTHTFPNSSL